MSPNPSRRWAGQTVAVQQVELTVKRTVEFWDRSEQHTGARPEEVLVYFAKDQSPSDLRQVLEEDHEVVYEQVRGVER